MSTSDVAPVLRVLVLLSLSIPSQCQSKSASTHTKQTELVTINVELVASSIFRKIIDFKT